MAFQCRIFCGTLTIIIGLCMIIVGAVLINIFAKMIHNTIASNVVLKNGTDSFNAWQSPPVPVHMQFWVFDLINKDEVMKDGSKPVVVEIGPFTYREIRPKDSIVFHENGTLSYVQNKSYQFVREMSVADASTTVTTVNLLYAVIAEKFEYSSSLVRKLVNDAFEVTGERLFDKYTVHDLIWGYRIDALKELADIIHVFSPKTVIPFDIGLFADINGTNDGTYNIFTGVNDTSKLNVIDKWNGERNLPYWTTDISNMINGTDGTSYHPFIDKSEKLFIFSSDLCRSIYVEYLKEVNLLGVDLYRFTAPSEVFANHTVNPDNIGYCTPNCLGAGVLNISACKGAPVVMSQPHFLDGAPEYLNAIDGMHPDPIAHRTNLDVEPHTGLVLNAGKRLQINVYIKNYAGISDTEKLPPLTIYPVAWLDESASLDQPSADKFESQVMTPILITQVVQYGLIALGAFLIVLVGGIFLASWFWARRSNADEDSQIQYERAKE